MELNGATEGNADVLVIGATNSPWQVDPALRRPGRFDRTLFVPPPDCGARVAILRLALRERPCAPDLDLDGVAERIEGFSGADLVAVVESATDRAMVDAAAQGKVLPVARRHLEAALDSSHDLPREEGGCGLHQGCLGGSHSIALRAGQDHGAPGVRADEDRGDDERSGRLIRAGDGTRRRFTMPVRDGLAPHHGVLHGRTDGSMQNIGVSRGRDDGIGIRDEGDMACGFAQAIGHVRGDTCQGSNRGVLREDHIAVSVHGDRKVGSDTNA